MLFVLALIWSKDPNIIVFLLMLKKLHVLVSFTGGLCMFKCYLKTVSACLSVSPARLTVILEYTSV